tara:strand:- start:16972 stop:17919 length:948 start_codon:yes stop_codon:yes gene_type:complete
MKVYKPSKKHAIDYHWYEFLAPKYWGTWLLLSLMRLFALLPYRVLIIIGSGLGWIFYRVVPKRRHIAAVNLKICLPELSDAEREHLLKRNFRSIGIAFMETALAWHASDKRLKKMVVVHGGEFVKLAKARHKGILAVTCHFSHIELGIRLMSMVSPLGVMYRPQNNLLFEWALQRARKKYVTKGIVRQDIRGMMTALKTPDLVTCYTPDQDVGREASVFATFFGFPASTVTGTSRFIKKADATVIPGFYYRDEKNKKYHLVFETILDDFPSDDDLADATRMNMIMEKAIRKAPEQYMWQHRRFKTRPDGEASVYE